MVAVSDSKPKNEEENNDSMNIISSGQGSGISAQTGPSQGSTQGGSGSFTNIQDYVKANKPKTAALSQGITGQAQKEGQALKSSLQDTRKSFLGQEGKFGQGAKDFVGNQISQAGQQTQQTDEQRQADVNRFADLRKGSVQGPDLTEQRSQAKDLQDRAKSYETSVGRFQGLQKLVGGQSATYGKGQRQLDNLLLAGDRESKQQSIRDIRGATRGLQDQVGSLQTDISSGRSSLKEQAQTGVAGAQDQLRGQLTDRYEGLRSGLESGQLSQEQLDSLGIQSGRTYGADLLGALGKNRAMTADESARLSSLAGLAGQERTFNLGLEGGNLGENLQGRIAQQKAAYDPLYTATDSDRAALVNSAWEGTRNLMGPSEFGQQVTEADARRMAQDSADATIAQRRAALEQQYSGNLGLAPQVKDGGVIQSKMEALKKMRGY